jgi:hypothetical protein
MSSPKDILSLIHQIFEDIPTESLITVYNKWITRLKWIIGQNMRAPSHRLKRNPLPLQMRERTARHKLLDPWCFNATALLVVTSDILHALLSLLLSVRSWQYEKVANGNGHLKIQSQRYWAAKMDSRRMSHWYLPATAVGFTNFELRLKCLAIHIMLKILSSDKVFGGRWVLR